MVNQRFSRNFLSRHVSPPRLMGGEVLLIQQMATRPELKEKSDYRLGMDGHILCSELGQSYPLKRENADQQIKRKNNRRKI